METGTDSYNLMCSFYVIMTAGVGYVLIREVLAYRSKYFAIMAFIGWLYPLGKLLQVLLIGPSWLRWHLADIGWTSCVAILLVFGKIVWRRSEGMSMLIATCYAAGFALVIEFVQIFFYPEPLGGKAIGAAGDWVDVVIFIIMYLVNAWLVFATAREIGSKHKKE